MSPEMLAAILEAQEARDYLDVNDPNYPTKGITGMSTGACQAVIYDSNVSFGRQTTELIILDGLPAVKAGEEDLPSCCAQWVLKGEIFIRSRPDLEETIEHAPTIIEIKQERRVAIVVIADEALACDEVIFAAYDPETHPDIDSIKLFNATPAEAEKLLQLAEPFSDWAGAANNLSNTRKQGASRVIKNSAIIHENPAA